MRSSTRRHVPDPVAEQQHQRRQQDDPHHRRVEQDRDRQPHAHLAHGRDRRGREGDEDRGHDRGGAGDHPGGLLQPEGDRGAVVAVDVVALAHPGDQEDRVVDREAEGDAEDRPGADRVDVGVAAERVARGDLADQGHHPDRGRHRGEVEADGEQRQQRRPQDEDQRQEGEEDEGADHQRQPRLVAAP